MTANGPVIALSVAPAAAGRSEEAGSSDGYNVAQRVPIVEPTARGRRTTLIQAVLVRAGDCPSQMYVKVAKLGAAR